MLALPTASAMTEFRVDVSGIGLSQMTIVIARFRQEDRSSQAISAIIRANLERSGQFRGTDANEGNVDKSTRPDLSKWRHHGADALVAGSVTKAADGRYAVRFRLWDVARGLDMGGRSYLVTVNDLRLASHRAADFIFETLTRNKGIFPTRIAYVTKEDPVYKLCISDADGENSHTALRSQASIISPVWSPDGTHVAYVSFESRKPVVYTHEITTGRRRLVANFRGSNSAPAWSPDGRTLAVTLTQDGESQIYRIDTVGHGEPQRLTKSSSIDTEPEFSPDGSQLYFVSDRGGSPQIYRMPVQIGIPERITFEGSYNISPSISSDGHWMAYISRLDGAFKLQVMNLSTGKVSAITDTSADENPSFSPNSMQIIYATRIQGREALMTTTLDGRTKARLAGIFGDVREPSWGPRTPQNIDL